MNENLIGKEVVDAAVKVYRELGPWVPETVYGVVVAKELESAALPWGYYLPAPSQAAV